MGWQINDREVEAVLKLGPQTRYQHFIKRVADGESLWGLRLAGEWVSLSDDAGRTAFPVWPHRQYAEICSTAEWAGAEPIEIPLEQFLEEWMATLLKDGRAIAVFLTPAGKGILVSPERLGADLREELSHYE